jgi:hypothetical protein
MNKILLTINNIEYICVPKLETNTDKVEGKYCVAYHCKSNPNGKPWQVELRKPAAKLMKGKQSYIIARVETRAEAERIVKQTDLEIEANYSVLNI